jgi:thiol-disulfide isomerase/thioredoxin
MSGGLVFVGALTLVNLLLLALMARRVRRLGPTATNPTRPPWLPPGTKVLDFEAMTIDGEMMSLDRLRGRHSLVGIFSASCEPCRDQVPVFARYASSYGGPDQVLAVVTGVGDKADEFVSQLRGKASVVREGPRGTVPAAFSANALPAVYLLDGNGRVVAGGGSISAVNYARPDVPAGTGD